jgi:chromate transporter
LSLRRFFLNWFWIGLQSFGGGAATLTLVRQAAVDRYGWLTAEEFTYSWALVQMEPGINLLALTILIGRQVAGWPGIAAGLAGLLLPSAAVTIALTAGYARLVEIQAHHPGGGLKLLGPAMHGVAPAVVGLFLCIAWQTAGPLLAASRREGLGSLSVSLAIIAGSALIATYLRVPIFSVLFGAAILGSLTAVIRSRRSRSVRAPQRGHEG